MDDTPVFGNSSSDVDRTNYQQERGKRQIQPNSQEPKQSRPMIQPIILGTLTFASNPTQTTVGAAGSATVLPAAPTGYLQLNIGGSTSNYVIPFYKAS